MVPLALTTVLSTADVAEGTHAGKGLEVHSLEAGIVLGPSIERRIAVDAHAEAALRAVIEERDHVGVHLGEIEEEVPRTDPGQALFLVCIRQSEHIVRIRIVIV